jgi:hypothetical protein
MSIPAPINVYVDQTFQTDLTTPVAATGLHGAPTLGAVTGVKFRLSATRTGAAIHVNVGDLAASERSSVPGRFYVDIDTALLVSHVLPLGAGARFWGIWSQAGNADYLVVPYRVADHTVVLP